MNCLEQKYTKQDYWSIAELNCRNISLEYYRTGVFGKDTDNHDLWIDLGF